MMPTMMLNSARSCRTAPAAARHCRNYCPIRRAEVRVHPPLLRADLEGWGSAGLGVGDGRLAHPLPQRVLQLRLLDEHVVLRRGVTGRLRVLPVEAEPLLHP